VLKAVDFNLKFQDCSDSIPDTVGVKTFFANIKQELLKLKEQKLQA